MKQRMTIIAFCTNKIFCEKFLKFVPRNVDNEGLIFWKIYIKEIKFIHKPSIFKISWFILIFIIFYFFTAADIHKEKNLIQFKLKFLSIFSNFCKQKINRRLNCSCLVSKHSADHSIEGTTDPIWCTWWYINNS